MGNLGTEKQERANMSTLRLNSMRAVVKRRDELSDWAIHIDIAWTHDRCLKASL
jgi:hypothetical protein